MNYGFTGFDTSQCNELIVWICIVLFVIVVERSLSKNRVRIIMMLKRTYIIQCIRWQNIVWSNTSCATFISCIPFTFRIKTYYWLMLSSICGNCCCCCWICGRRWLNNTNGHSFVRSTTWRNSRHETVMKMKSTCMICFGICCCRKSWSLTWLKWRRCRQECRTRHLK